MSKSKYLKNQKGFTFIEMLLVLTIFTLISTIVSQLTIKTFERQAIDQFLVQVSLDIQRMQTLSMREGTHTTITFLDKWYKGHIHNDLTNYVFEKEYPSGITLESGSNLKKIKFYNNGEISDFGKVIFKTPFGKREVIVNIEKGRLRFVEQ
ncbi:competence type IV pilus minor pilin ComGD [Ureibacillus sp. MALMAid1270]|uniref:competence type IV pilus minor pilin ComGD n=1 Tax=Ureibacillus sp. MALMAid1270 TaxID=3411629 RepID=UPI003BA67DCC